MLDRKATTPINKVFLNDLLEHFNAPLQTNVFLYIKNIKTLLTKKRKTEINTLTC